MSSSRAIGKVLRHVLSLSIPPLVGGCGIDTSSFEPIACGDEGNVQHLRGVKPSAAADYVELRGVNFEFGPPPGSSESIGEKCATAADKPACEAAIAAATSAQGFRLGDCVDWCPQYYLVVNTGDDVTVVNTKDGLKAWIGAVDAPADAVLVARAEGYYVPCNNPDEGGVRPAGDAYDVLATKFTAICDPVERTLYVLAVGADGSVQELQSEVIESRAGVCIGRRPAGLVRLGGRGATRVGAYFANVAQLEAASVRAFADLERELAHHGAPRSLVQRARAAGRDEVRHAQVMRRVAARYGGRWQPPRVEKRPVRSLEELALDNAAEGCVRETFGALVGMWQARFSRDPVVRRVMKGIARDETRHASLSWAIDAWVRPRLSDAERRRMADARRAALDEIEQEARRGHDPALVRWAGMPGGQAAKKLARDFAAAIAANG